MVEKLARALLVLIWVGYYTANAVQAQEFLNTPEFRGVAFTMVVTDPDGQVRTKQCVTRLGATERRSALVPVFAQQSQSTIAALVATGDHCLLFEHWWKSFETLARNQRGYAQCVERIKTFQRFRGETCMIDDPTCGDFVSSMLTVLVRDYWVPSFVVPLNAPTIEQLGAEFEAGIAGANGTYFFYKACEASADIMGAP